MTPYLRVANVLDGYIDTSDVLQMPFTSDERARFSLKPGDILLNEGQSLELVGRSAIYVGDPKNCCFQNTLVRFRARVGTDHRYAQYVFESYLRRGEFAKIAMQTTSIAHLGTGRFAKMVFLAPPYEEQVAIGAALADADALIDSLEQMLAKKRQIKQGAMQELLTGKRRLPGFDAKWRNRFLGDLAKIQRGASPRPIDDPIWFDDSSSVGWVRISDVTQSGMHLKMTTQRLSEAGIRKSRFVGAGNLIMSICATVGRPIITALDTCIHDGFVVFDGLTINQNFLYYALLNIEDDWSQHGQTGSQMNLNTGLINGTSIPVPDDEAEQAAIAQVLSDMDADIAETEARLTKARDLKQAMAQALLTGRVRLVEGAAA